MTPAEKEQFVQELAAKIRQNPNFYLVDMGGMTVAQSNNFRRKLFEKKLSVHMAKNSLIRKALEQVAAADGKSYDGIYPVLKSASSLIFAGEQANEPAKLIKDFLASTDKPVVKGAYLEEAAFTGEGILDTLVSLKGKAELLGEIIGLLQSPIANVIGGLQASGNKVAGLVAAIGESKAAA